MSFIKFYFKAIPLAIGMILTLVSLTFLASFFNYGQDFDEPDFWIFLATFMVGFPVLLWGTNKLSSEGT